MLEHEFETDFFMTPDTKQYFTHRNQYSFFNQEAKKLEEKYTGWISNGLMIAIIMAFLSLPFLLPLSNEVKPFSIFFIFIPAIFFIGRPIKTGLGLVKKCFKLKRLHYFYQQRELFKAKTIECEDKIIDDYKNHEQCSELLMQFQNYKVYIRQIYDIEAYKKQFKMIDDNIRNMIRHKDSLDIPDILFSIIELHTEIIKNPLQFHEKKRNVFIETNTQ